MGWNSMEHEVTITIGFVLNSTGFKSGLALSILSNLKFMSVCDLDISAKVELVVSECSSMLCISSRFCCCICSVKVLARLSIIATEEGLEEELLWREINFISSG